MSNQLSTHPDNTPIEPGSGEQQFKLLLGRILALIGLVIVVAAVISLFTSQSASVASIAPGAIALALGGPGYLLGSRRLGLGVAVLAIVLVFLSVAATQGIVPGAGPNDRVLPQQETGSIDPTWGPSGTV